MKCYDIIVVGGGASGLTAAIEACRAGRTVCVLETQPRVGKKLLATGNGRCNLSNTAICAGTIRQYYRCDDFSRLEALFELCPPSEVFAFLRSVGIELREEQGRLYPRSEKASCVLDMLRFALEAHGAQLCCDSKVAFVCRDSSGYIVSLNNGSSLSSEKLIIACGSPAAPNLSGSASGASLMCSLGHHAKEFQPSLAPISVRSPYLKQLKGTRVHCSASLICKGKALHTEQGELQFNEDNLSGIMIFQLAARLPKNSLSGCEISIDLIPDTAPDDLKKQLQARAKALAYLQNDAFLCGLLPKQLALVTLKRAGLAAGEKVGVSLGARAAETLANVIKHFSFTELSLCSFAQAQTASGGIPLSELSDELESHYSPGVYCCGELLNCDGDCGGFNLHLAWLSGIICGRAASE